MHHDDSTSSDDVASIEADEGNALVGVLHQGVDKPFSVNRDQVYLMLVLLSPHDDDSDVWLKKMEDKSVDDLRSLFLNHLLKYLHAPLDCVPSIVHRFHRQHHTYHIALAMEMVSAVRVEYASAELAMCLFEWSVMLMKQFWDLSHCLRFVLTKSLMKLFVYGGLCY